MLTGIQTLPAVTQLQPNHENTRDVVVYQNKSPSLVAPVPFSKTPHILNDERRSLSHSALLAIDAYDSTDQVHERSDDPTSSVDVYV